VLLTGSDRLIYCIVKLFYRSVMNTFIRQRSQYKNTNTKAQTYLDDAKHMYKIQTTKLQKAATPEDHLFKKSWNSYS